MDKKLHIEAGKHKDHRDLGSNSKSGLTQVAARARTNPKAKFSNLMHHLTPELLEDCLSGMNKKSSTGVDGMTVEQVRNNLDWLMRKPMEDIHKKRYEAKPVKRVYIPKGSGKQRPIGIPTVLDRVLQAGMTRILNQIYEQEFVGCSYGFREGRSCHNALATIDEMVQNRGMNYALEVDIRDFFGSLSHKWLRKFLEHRISDKRVLELINSWLKAGVMEEGEWQRDVNGTPQGGSISPLLANIYLHYVLDLWYELKIKKQLKGKSQLVRYCDDFVILFQKEEDVEYLEPLLKARLDQFGLKVAEEKTHRTDLRPRENKGKDRRHMTFLGFNIHRQRKRRSSGYKVVFQTDSKRYGKAKENMKNILRKVMHWELRKQAKLVNAILRGHVNYYGLAGNIRKIQSFFYEVIRSWRRALSRRSQRGTIRWEEMRKILKEYINVKPKLRIGYKQLGTYVML